jgi:hypothetical protein
LWFISGLLGTFAALAALALSGATAKLTSLRVLCAWTWPLLLLARGGRELLEKAAGRTLWRS